VKTASRDSRRLVRRKKHSHKGAVAKHSALSPRGHGVGRRDTSIVKREPPTLAEAVEQVLIAGDLSPLTPPQRLDYYRAVCKSLGLNPLTRPFDYIIFRENDGGPGKLQLYARKDCTEQLRKLYGVGVTSINREIREDICIVQVSVKDKTNKPDVGTGAVALYKFKDGKRIKLDGKEFCNAIMKAETKAKRRATLSVCGLGFLDESELESVANYGEVTAGGREIVELENLRGSPERFDHQLKAAQEEVKNLPFVELKPFHEGCLSINGTTETLAKLAAAGLVKSATYADVAGLYFIPEDKAEAFSNWAFKNGVDVKIARSTHSRESDPIISGVRSVNDRFLAFTWDGRERTCWHKSMWPLLTENDNKPAKLSCRDNTKNDKSHSNVEGIISLNGVGYELGQDDKWHPVIQREPTDKSTA
jgi:hypothetical protein